MLSLYLSVRYENLFCRIILKNQWQPSVSLDKNKNEYLEILLSPLARFKFS